MSSVSRRILRNVRGWKRSREIYLPPGTALYRGIEIFLSVVEGRVEDGVSGRGLENASILLSSLNAEDEGAAVEERSGRQGGFEIHAVPEGRYSLRVRCAGYEPAGPREIELLPNQDETALVIPLRPVRDDRR